MPHHRWLCVLPVMATTLLSACTAIAPTAPLSPAAAPLRVQLPLQTAWFDDSLVHYVTTDVSDAALARERGANFAPRLALALPPADAPPGLRRHATDKVYKATNFSQPPVFASAPQPAGPDSRSTSYSPLWQMVTFTWQPGHTPRELRSEEAVLAAEERGQIRLQPTTVVLNCPVIMTAGQAVPVGQVSSPAVR